MWLAVWLAVAAANCSTHNITCNENDLEEWCCDLAVYNCSCTNGTSLDAICAMSPDRTCTASPTTAPTGPLSQSVPTCDAINVTCSSGSECCILATENCACSNTTVVECIECAISPDKNCSLTCADCPGAPQCTAYPTMAPTAPPTGIPTPSPSELPTEHPTAIPTLSPTASVPFPCSWNASLACVNRSAPTNTAAELAALGHVGEMETTVCGRAARVPRVGEHEAPLTPLPAVDCYTATIALTCAPGTGIRTYPAVTLPGGSTSACHAFFAARGCATWTRDATSCYCSRPPVNATTSAEVCTANVMPAATACPTFRTMTTAPGSYDRATCLAACAPYPLASVNRTGGCACGDDQGSAAGRCVAAPGGCETNDAAVCAAMGCQWTGECVAATPPAPVVATTHDHTDEWLIVTAAMVFVFLGAVPAGRFLWRRRKRMQDKGAKKSEAKQRLI